MTIQVYDFFSGCGGTSCGLSDAGFDIVFALDNDSKALDTYQENFPNATVLVENIKNVEPETLGSMIGRRSFPLLFCGCAPCQPFSKQNKNKSDTDPRRDLLSEFSRFVSYWQPEYILVENVPGIQKLKKQGPFDSFLHLLDQYSYNYDYGVLPASGYGVPQRRERLVLVASLKGEVVLPPLTHGPGTGKPYSTVEDWISGLPELAAGEVCLTDPDHQAAGLSELNLVRVRSTPEGGGRESWPEDLWLNCHKEHNGHTDVYGRLHWKKVASGLTTRCISLSNGRFGHPSQDRAISIREAACLQTFPRSYRFKGNMASRARQIGNAVPPLMAKEIAKSILDHHESMGT